MLKIDLNPDKKLLRLFGFFSVAGFAVMAIVFYWKLDAPGWLFWSLLGLGVVQALAAWAEEYLLIRPVYMVMSVIGMGIGFVVGPIVLGLMFFGMFTPLALWFRLVGRTSIDKKLDREAVTYWRDRKGPISPARYLRLY